MYTITVKISDRGTILLDENDTSATGHMWYSVSDGSTTNSFGFAPSSFPSFTWECIHVKQKQKL